MAMMLWASSTTQIVFLLRVGPTQYKHGSESVMLEQIEQARIFSLASDVAVLLPAEAITDQLIFKPPIWDRAVQQFSLVEHFESSIFFSNDFPDVAFHGVSNCTTTRDRDTSRTRRHSPSLDEGKR